MFAIKFGSLTLDGLSQWKEKSNNRVTSYSYPRRPGSIAPRVPALDSREITVTGEIWGDTEVALRALLDDWNHTFSDLGRDRLILWDDGRYINAVKRTFDYGFDASKVPSLRADINISFFCDDPYYYSPSSSTATVNTTGTGANFAVTNNGKTRTPFVIEIIRSGAGTDIPDVIITNSTTGLWVRWDGTFVLGTKLVFDMINRRCLMAGANSLNAVSGSMNMALEPGLNNLVYQGPGNVDITTIWQERWA